MGYSLGDDKESFDVYEQTNKILENIGDKLIEEGWVFDNKKYHFTKNDRTLKLETSQDHVSDLYISDSSIDYEKFCRRNPMYDIVHDYDDGIYGVCLYVSKNTDVNKIVRNIEYAPLKDKNNDFEL